MPTVSIIMPAWNTAHYIGEAIDSVQRQSHGDWELIAVDDGSTDETAAIVQSRAQSDRRIQLISQSNTGRAGIARNVGLTRAQGEYIAFLDSDDFYEPRRIELSIAAFSAFPEAGIVFHDMFQELDGQVRADDTFLEAMDFRARVREYCLDRKGDACLLSPRYYVFMALNCLGLHTNSTVVRRSAFRRSELRFREDLVVTEDMDLWMRLAAQSRVAFVDQPLATYRRHSEGLMSRKLARLGNSLVTHEANFQRLQTRLNVSERLAYRQKITIRERQFAYALAAMGRSAEARRVYWRVLRSGGSFSDAMGLIKTYLPWNQLRQAKDRAACRLRRRERPGG